MNEELGATLGKAGLRLIRVIDADVPLVPPRVASYASSCRTGEVLIGESIDLHDAALVEKTNAALVRIAREGGLFEGDQPRFLVAFELESTEDDDIAWWAEVELLGEWDLAGIGASDSFLGSAWGRPAFILLSLAGDVVLRVDCGEVDVRIVLLRQPHRIGTLRNQGEFLAGWRDTDEFTRGVIERWLGAHPLPGAG